MPMLSYVAVGGPDDKQLEGPFRKVRRISEGDWMRLAFIDDPGDSRTWPYSPQFFNGPPLAEFAYDRFWHSTGTEPAQDGFNTTRWMCCGYGLVGVGDGSDSNFFTNEDHGALCHFRHHYKSLALIALFHRASLLTYKHRLAEISDEMLKASTHIEERNDEEERNDAFRKSSERLAKEFMRFRTLYWFSEVTNHVQGTELFHMFRKHLNLDVIFKDVSSDIESATSLMRQWDQKRQLKNSNQLAAVAAILAMMVPAFLWIELGLVGDLNNVAHWSLGLLLVGLVLGVFSFVSTPLELQKRIRSSFPLTKEKGWVFRGCLAAITMAIGLFLLLFDARSSPHESPMERDLPLKQDSPASSPGAVINIYTEESSPNKVVDGDETKPSSRNEENSSTAK